NINEIVVGIIAGAALTGKVLNKRQIARQAHLKFRQDSAGRLDGLAMTQTQQASEGAKNTEVKTLIKDNAVFPTVKVKISTSTVTKTWHAVLDNRTRIAHAEADGQTVPFNQVYTVDGQSLRYPGDTSLGATLDNIINCRCSSVKSIERG
ncbi:MAG: hypothetical protein KAS04_06710, partial [Candidatus Aenigmarchaeota archaeon]|nr:hypothetical protein [Candidatus Aenigmarchaeota archaeon]